MAVLTKITSRTLADNSVTSAKISGDVITASDLAPNSVDTSELAAEAVTVAKMDADTGVQTEYHKVPVYANDSARNTAISSPANGMIIYNTAETALQQYNGTWSTVAPAPTISSTTGTINEDTNATMTVNGSQFVSGMTVKLVVASSGADIAGHTALTYNLVSATQITVTIPSATTALTPGLAVQIQVIKSGLSVNSSSLTVSEDPNWTTNAGTLATIYDYHGTNTAVVTIAASAGAGGGTLVYASDDNSLANQFVLNSSTGAITTHASNALTGLTGSGTATEAFNANAKISGDATKNTVRAFNIIVKKGATGGTGASGTGDPYIFTGNGTTGTNGQKYKVHEFWYSGTGNYYDHTFTIYEDLANVEFLVIAGGGSGGIYATGVGYQNGLGGNSSHIYRAGPVALIDTVGGGYGARYQSQTGGTGGSGGGGGGPSGAAGVRTVGEGYAGGAASAGGGDSYGPGGGGGAGQAGSAAGRGIGGNGRASYITGASITRGGGGGGSSTGYNGVYAGGSGGGGAGGNGTTGSTFGVQGTDGMGGGGGADDHGVGAGHGGGGAGGYRSAVYVASSAETSGGGAAGQAKLNLLQSQTPHIMRVGAGGAAVGNSNATSGRGGHGIIVIRYPIT